MRKLLVCVLLAAAVVVPGRPAQAFAPLPAYCQAYPNQDLSGGGRANADAYSCCDYLAWNGPTDPTGYAAHRIQTSYMYAFGIYVPLSWRCFIRPV